jgi:hypothetical protein
MPTIFRAMKRADDNLPVVERSARGLGVRQPPSPHADVDVDGHGNVVLNLKGTSVARHWRDLPPHRIPERLDDGEIGATGPNTDRCWRTGDGGFIPGLIAKGLELVHKQHDPTRGNVVPSGIVPLAQFQDDLGATRSQWVVDET